MEEEDGISIIRSIGRSLSNAAGSFRTEDVFFIGDGGSHHGRNSQHSVEDEEALRWAALEKLPTYNRIRTTIFKSYIPSDLQNQTPDDKLLLDVRELDPNARQDFIDRTFKVVEEDNERFLKKFKDRVDKVGISLPTVEVRFQNLTVEAECYVGDRALPSLPNATRNIFEAILGNIGISLSKKTKLTILKDASGIIKPSRMALLLGPPSSGKTTLLLAMAGKLDRSLKIHGTKQLWKISVPEWRSRMLDRGHHNRGVLFMEALLGDFYYYWWLLPSVDCYVVVVGGGGFAVGSLDDGNSRRHYNFRHEEWRGNMSDQHDLVLVGYGQA